MRSASEKTLRRLTIGDREFCRSLVTSGSSGSGHALDARSTALLLLGATIASGTSGPIWHQRVSDALESGIDRDEVVEALASLAPMIGIDRVVAIAPEVARALGYDVDAELERHEVLGID